MKRNLTAVIGLLLVCCMLPVAASALTLARAVHITHHRTVNVRSGLGKDYAFLGEVRPGEYYEYLGTKNGWNCIRYTASTKGYVSGNLTTLDGEVWDSLPC